MGTYKNTKKYKSTAFLPSDDIDYKKLVISTLKEKYRYFVVGIGVLFGVLAATGYLLTRGPSTIVVNSNNAKPKVVNQKAVVQPTKVMAKAVSPTLQPTLAPTTVKKAVEVVDKPKVDQQKAAEAANAKPGKGYTKYIVKAGDTLWKIAEKTYKSGFNYTDLVAYNKIQNPNSLVVGQELLMPTLVPKLPTDPTVLSQGGVGGPEVQGEIGEGAMTGVVTDTSTNYSVVKGDTLWSIAERTFGDGFAWKQLANANGISDPVKLEVGTKLVIPR